MNIRNYSKVRILHKSILKVRYILTIAQCKSFCVTHFKEMITKIGKASGRISLKKIARYCKECGVWYWRKLWLSIYCPCCHMKLTDELKNPIIPKEIRMVKWNLKNRDRRNKYKSEWAKEKRRRLKECVNAPFVAT